VPHLAIGVSYGAPYQFAGIAFYNKYGQPDGFVATGSYVPASLCFADDHSLWTFGRQRGRGDYMVVHHFSGDRKDAGQFLARSSFPKGLDPGTGHWQMRSIVVAQDRVGLFAFSGSNGSLNEWVEIDLSGKLIRRLRLDQEEFTPMAFTADGHPYRKPNYKSALQVLSQTTSEWQEAGMEAGIGALGSLLGSDGNSLVFSPTASGPITMQWFNRPVARPALSTTLPQRKQRTPSGPETGSVAPESRFSGSKIRRTTPLTPEVRLNPLRPFSRGPEPTSQSGTFSVRTHSLRPNL